MSNSVEVLYAPLSGRTIELENVPDPVFAQKMAGDGIAVDPVSQVLCAPCDGSIVNVHRSCHALTMKTSSGLEVLMHIGLDTVSLKGEGFTPKVKAGDSVKKGQPLIEFDAASVAEKAKSLITMMLIANTEAAASIRKKSGRLKAGQDILLEVELKENAQTAAAPAVSGPEASSDLIEVRNPQGFHFRPVSVLSRKAAGFYSDIRIIKGGSSANCKSTTDILSLEIMLGDKVKFQARGADSAEAVKELGEALRGGLGEDIKAAPAAVSTEKAEAAAEVSLYPPDTDSLFHGASASPGIAVGQIFQMRRREFSVTEEGSSKQAERENLDKALNQAKTELGLLESTMKEKADPNKAAIFAAHAELLSDPELADQVYGLIEKGKSAAFSWKTICDEQTARFSKLSAPLLKARAADMRDVEDRVLRILIGDAPAEHSYPADTILIAEDLTPSDTAALDCSKVVGFATVLGGASSHTAILARSLDLPAMAGVSSKLLNIPNGTKAILQGSKGTLELNPDDARFEQAKERLKAQREHRALLRSKAKDPAVTTDGTVIEIAANIGSVADAEQAVELGADGVGLLRSEFLFMSRTTPPTEDEQAEIYINAAKAVGKDAPLIIRTLDVGGDKPLAYLPIGKEANPFLGERGLRVGLTHPEILRTQFRAILRAAEFAKVQIMMPMVTTIDEFRRAKAIFDEECEALKTRVPLGIMIEVPAAAVMAETLAREAEFFSIGTNDLTQYTLAIDRGHPKLAAMADGLSPAVLHMIKMTADGAHAHGRKVGICGGIGGDLQATAILIGLGVDELSVAAPAIPAVKDRVRQVSTEECRRLAEKALSCESAQDVRKLQEEVEL